MVQLQKHKQHHERPAATSEEQHRIDETAQAAAQAAVNRTVELRSDTAELIDKIDAELLWGSLAVTGCQQTDS